MKHPVRDRFLILLCALAMLAAAAGVVALVLGQLTLEPVIAVLENISTNMTIKKQIVLGVAAVVLALYALLLLGALVPGKKKNKRSSNFAIQHNENGTVRISVKALEALVQRCLNQHAELKVVTSSLYSDEETVSVDVHITLQSDISMPLAISSLQKQIKRYLEACAGVEVKEVRVFVDGAMAPKAGTSQSPYALPASVLSECTESLSDIQEEAETAAQEQKDELVLEVPDAEPAQPSEEAAAEEAAPAEEEAPEQKNAEESGMA
ncbi:MAG: alkaline shock response membrane anchor protein AmaP [Clostridia bacterium]|nr:alkaline shock response membrane anchor protein AmaP [Clostridia bacterium]